MLHNTARPVHGTRRVGRTTRNLRNVRPASRVNRGFTELSRRRSNGSSGSFRHTFGRNFVYCFPFGSERKTNVRRRTTAVRTTSHNETSVDHSHRFVMTSIMVFSFRGFRTWHSLVEQLLSSSSVPKTFATRRNRISRSRRPRKVRDCAKTACFGEIETQSSAFIFLSSRARHGPRRIYRVTVSTETGRSDFLPNSIETDYYVWVRVRIIARSNVVVDFAFVAARYYELDDRRRDRCRNTIVRRKKLRGNYIC